MEDYKQIKIMFSRKTVIILLGFIIILAVGTLAVLRYLNKGENLPKTSEPAGGVRVIDEVNIDNQDIALVRYTEHGFEPLVLSIAADRGLGCAVKLINQNKASLKFGLSPHKASGDPGRDYPPIQPGEIFLFDPRFTGFTELSFHDHERPELGFLVKFEPSCQ